MSRSQYLQRVVHLSLAAAAINLAVPAYAQQAAPEKSTSTLTAVIVTAQKKEESIQDVPIAVSAFSSADLAARGLDGGPSMLQAIPNVSFSKSNFTSFNLQIRGVGTKLVGGSGDQGVGIHLNNAPLTVSRFFEAEFYDMERVEVLRGPQGTVYGRNATGGVFNAITAKPTDKFEGAATLDLGNYNSRKVKGMVNLPLGDTLELRVAGSLIKRDGFVHETLSNTDIDGRNISAGRATLAFKPSDSVHASLMWEHFNENDDRQRVGKQLCTKDTGPATVGGVSTTQVVAGAQARWYLSQGCLPGSIYSSAAFQSVNSNAALGGLLANLIGLQSGDAFANKVVSTNMRTTESPILPTYKAYSDVAMFNLEIKPSDDLTLTSLTSYNRDNLESRSDYSRAAPSVNFNNVFNASGVFVGPGGTSNYFTDPQIGRTNSLSVFDISYSKNTTWTEELRLQSAFSGPINFNVGAIYVDQKSPVNGGYYVLFNSATEYARVAAPTVGIDPNAQPNTLGHNYYLNLQSFELRSLAGFGELYWQMTDSFKWTAGLRYTDDKKNATNYDIVLLTPGTGWTPAQIKPQEVQFKETTGRFGFDWKLSDNSLLYAFLSRGYKAGGFNPATQNASVPASFDPEFVNALEIGTKNTFADGTLQLNATGFYYNYSGYQISRIEQKTSINSNIDAKIYGAELEMIWQPIQDLRFDGNVGYLRTKIKGGTAIDLMNRTQGDATQTVMKASDGSNCVVPTAGLATLIGLINAGTSFIPVAGGGTRSATPTDLLGACSGAWGALGITPTEGTAISLNGKELPNAPHLTVNVGAQKSVALDDNWTGTFRADYYRQSDSYSRIYNTNFDRLKGWSNVNLSITVDNAQNGMTWLLYVKNLIGDDNITDTYLTDDSSGLWSNTFVTDPRLIGVSFTKKF